MVRPENIISDALQFIKNLKFNSDGLIPVIAQQYDSGEVLMMAWMNSDAVIKTLNSGEMYYWSRSRKALWRKGETSGQTQALKKIMADCDSDCLLALVDQKGVACHTGRKNCFFYEFSADGVKINQTQLIDPEKLYAD